METRAPVVIERQVQDIHWTLWAADQQQLTRARLGYAGQSNIHRTGRRAKEVDPTEPPKRSITPADHRIAEAIADVVSMLTQRQDVRAWIAKTYHGAWPGAPLERGARIAMIRRRLSCSDGLAYQKVRLATAYIAGAVEQTINGG